MNATEVGFSGAGSLEYSDLEAVDAGCLLVLPTHRNTRDLTHPGPEASPTRASRGLTHPEPRGPEASPIDGTHGAYAAREFELSKCLNAELFPLGPEREATLKSLAEACELAAGDWEDLHAREAIREYNLERMREVSDPRKYAELVLESALR